MAALHMQHGRFRPPDPSSADVFSLVLFTATDNQGMLRICRKLNSKGELVGGEYRFLFRPSLGRTGSVP